MQKTHFLLLVSSVFALSACSTMQGLHNEENASPVLKKPVSSIIYTIPRAELAKAVEREATRAIEYHKANTPLYAVGDVFSSKGFKFQGEPCDLADAGLREPLDADECKGVQRKAIELHVASETYVIAPVKDDARATRVQILNTADGKRKYLHELQFYGQVNPAGAAKIRKEALATKPDLDLNAVSF